MNSATFKTLLDALGLSSREFAELTGANPRTVRRWCYEIDPAPRAVETVTWLTKAFTDNLNKTRDGLKKIETEQGVAPEFVELARYRSEENYRQYEEDDLLPWLAHCGLISFLAVALMADGYKVKVKYL